MKNMNLFKEPLREEYFFDAEYSFTPIEALGVNEAEMAKALTSFGILGVVEGPFFAPGCVSRNVRYYPHELWQRVLQDPEVLHDMQMHLMFGTIGHDLPINDAALREGLVSHFITDLWINTEVPVESGQGYGRAYILDTVAGKALATLLRAKCRLSVSSRATGTLTNKKKDGAPVMDIESYRLIGFDFVRKPGFVQALPGYNDGYKGELHTEGTEETADTNILEEINESFNLFEEKKTAFLHETDGGSDTPETDEAKKAEVVSHPEMVAQSVTVNTEDDSLSKGAEAYTKYFMDALKKFGVKSPAELDVEKKKEFFNYVDDNWDAKGEAPESVPEEQTTSEPDHVPESLEPLKVTTEFIEENFSDSNGRYLGSIQLSENMLVLLGTTTSVLVESGKENVIVESKEFSETIESLRKSDEELLEIMEDLNNILAIQDEDIKTLGEQFKASLISAQTAPLVSVGETLMESASDSSVKIKETIEELGTSISQRIDTLLSERLTALSENISGSVTLTSEEQQELEKYRQFGSLEELTAAMAEAAQAVDNAETSHLLLTERLNEYTELGTAEEIISKFQEFSEKIADLSEKNTQMVARLENMGETYNKSMEEAHALRDKVKSLSTSVDESNVRINEYQQTEQVDLLSREYPDVAVSFIEQALTLHGVERARTLVEEQNEKLNNWANAEPTNRQSTPSSKTSEDFFSKPGESRISRLFRRTLT